MSAATGNETRHQNRAFRLLTAISQRRPLAILLILELIVAALVVIMAIRVATISDGAGILDAEFGYTHEQVVSTFDAYGQEGFDAYRSVQLLDIIHPALYSLLLAAILFRTQRDSRRWWFALAPLAMAALDYIENAFIWIMTDTYPDISPGLVSTSSAVSVIKNLSIVLVVVGVVVAFRKWRTSRHD